MPCNHPCGCLPHSNRHSNPLVGDIHADTLSRCSAVLTFLQEIIADTMGGEVNLSETATNGLYMILQGVTSALREQAGGDP